MGYIESVPREKVITYIAAVNLRSFHKEVLARVDIQYKNSISQSWYMYTVETLTVKLMEWKTLIRRTIFIPSTDTG